MTPADVSNLIQSVAILAAVVTSVVGFAIARSDRREARRLAAANHAATVRHAQLMFQLEALSRLTGNLNRGGSSDPAESKRLGAEALTLIGLLNEELLPGLWPERVGDEAKLRELLDEPEMPEWKKQTIEAQLGINMVLERLRSETERTSF